MFNYPGEYVQLPWGVFSTTLGTMFNYPGEYIQLPWGVCTTTLGEYVQLPWGVCSTTLGSIFNYLGEYLFVQQYWHGSATPPSKKHRLGSAGSVAVAPPKPLNGLAIGIEIKIQLP